MIAKFNLLTGVCPALLMLTSAAGSAHAASLLINGGFESAFTGWTTVDQTGGALNGWQIQTGTLSPVNLVTVPAPPQGTHAAMTDTGGPGSHALLQSFTVTPGSLTTLSFSLFVGNQATFFNPASLDFNTIPNQQVRVDVLTGATTVANAFSLSSVVDNVLDPTADTAAYVTYSFNITNVVGAGGTFTLRFAEVDNQNILNFGVDNVAIVTGLQAVPEPAPVGPVATVVALLLFFAAMQRRAQAHI
jgi:hypothetical protein